MKKNILIGMLFVLTTLALVQVSLGQQYYTPGFYNMGGNSQYIGNYDEGYYPNTYNANGYSTYGTRNPYNNGYLIYGSYNQLVYQSLHGKGLSSLHAPYTGYATYNGNMVSGAPGSKSNPITNKVFTSSDAPDTYSKLSRDIYYQTIVVNNENTNNQITPVDRIHHDTVEVTTRTTTSQINARQVETLPEGE